MTPEQWEQTKRLFLAALEREPALRADFLAEACAGDAALFREVESLLAAHEGDESFIETPAADVAAALLAENQTELAPGQMVGPFRVEGALARGGMGEVYLAEDTRLGRRVALKLLPPQFTADADRVRRFEREARAASALNHPNIVTIHEIGHADSLHFIATEFVEGVTLREHLSKTRMTVGEVLDVAAQIASALQAAHKAGIVHRDVKPENVMVHPDGYVKVLDFGLAKLAPHGAAPAGSQAPARLTTETNPGVVMGTAQYMSPEQARGLEVDARTDVWSLGVLLYEMLAGRAPFEGATPSHVVVSILEHEPPPLALGAEAPDELGRIVARALSKEKAERYPTAGEMALELKSLREELTVEARLKRSHQPNGRGEESAARGDGFGVVEAIREPAARTGHVIPARTTASVKYLVGEIQRRRKGAWLGATAVLAVVVAAAAYAFYPVGGGEAIDSVAVLPFANAGNDPNAEYLSDGISDSLINSLSQTPGLKRVISLNSALRYKGRQVDPQTVGREFNVRAVLMGRLIQQGDDLLISAELVDARDNRRLWGEQYHRKLSDILVVQRELAQQISSGLRLRLSGTEKKQIAKQHTENPDAEIAYLKGRHFLAFKRSGRDTEKSIKHLEEAVKLDPNYALAHATLASAYLTSSTLGPFRMEEVIPRAKEAVAKALAIDDTLAEAHAALGSIRYFGWDWAGAEREFKRAIELNPNYKPSSPHYEQYLVKMKRYDEAVAESKRVLELDPVSPYYNRNVGMILYFARRYDEAIEQLQKTLELEPEMGTAYNWLWRAYEQKGQYDQSVEAFLKFYGPIKQQGPEAVAAFREAYARSGWKGFWRKVLDLNMERAERGVNLHALAENYARLGERDQALFWLEKAVAQREEAMTLHIRNPVWDGFRSDPRFANLIRRMGLEP